MDTPEMINILPLLANSKKVDKVWGTEYWLVNNDFYCAKVLEIKPGFQCSLHYHEVKDETFIILDGFVELQSELQLSNSNNPISSVFSMKPGDKQRIRPNTRHRFSSIAGALILEISTNHSDEDVVRITESGPIKC